MDGRHGKGRACATFNLSDRVVSLHAGSPRRSELLGNSHSSHRGGYVVGTHDAGAEVDRDGCRREPAFEPLIGRQIGHRVSAAPGSR